MKKTNQDLINKLMANDAKIFDLEQKLKEACARLRMCADGTFVVSEVAHITDASTRLKSTAAHGLARIAQMRQR
jgi:hypothetical protein